MEPSTLTTGRWDGRVETSATRLPERDPDGELADRLAREFDAPVGLLDPFERIWRVRLGVQAEEFPNPEAASCTVLGLEGLDRVFLWRPLPTSGPVWLGLPIPGEASGRLIALVGFTAGRGPETPTPWGPPCPEPALRAWGEAVHERLRSDSSCWIAAPRRSIPAPLTERLVRRLRVSDPPERFQRLVVRAIREALGAGAVAWVPASPREPVVVEGHAGELSAEAFRTLVPESSDESVRVLNETAALGPKWSVVVATDKEAGAGWLVLIRPAAELAFQAGEIEMLRSSASIISAQRSNARLYGDLKDLLFGIIRALTSAIDAKDPYTSGHSERVARIAVRLGEQLGLSPNERGDLYLMGLLHDVGKIGIEDSVLKKPDRLTPEEYRLIQSHVRIGVHILSDLKKLHHLLPGVAHHHENLDGSGYPSGLAGESIPLAARILAVADAFDAMSSSRPYRRRLSPSNIDEIFREGNGKQWDPRVVEALFACRDEIERIRSKGLGDSLRRVVGDTLGRHEGLT